MTEIIVAVLSGVFTVLCTSLTVFFSSKQNAKMFENKLEIKQAVTDEKIDELTREVRQHNNFAIRIPVLEEQLKVANHRIEDLERGQSK